MPLDNVCTISSHAALTMFSFLYLLPLSCNRSDGNGFKASTMRLGADVIVFSRHRYAELVLSLIKFAGMKSLHFPPNSHLQIHAYTFALAEYESRLQIIAKNIKGL